jgi:hypothetical protein
MKVMLITFIMLSYGAFASSTSFSLEDALINIKIDKENTIKQVEHLFDNTEDLKKRAIIAYFLTLDISFKTKRSQNYYLKMALKHNQSLESVEQYRLTRTLADLEFKKGELKSALTNYEKALKFKESARLKDYLTLQKFWVLVNLNRNNEALNMMQEFLVKHDSQMKDSIVQDFGKIWAESIHQNIQVPKLNIYLLEKHRDSLLSGIYSGHARELGNRKTITKKLLNSKMYNDFYSFGLKENKFPGDVNCEILNWKLPKELATELSDTLINKTYKCISKKDNYKKYKASSLKVFKKLYSSNYRSIPLALLSEQVSENHRCEIYSDLIIQDKSFDLSANNFALACLESNYKETIFGSLVQRIDHPVVVKMLSSGHFNELLAAHPVINKIKNTKLLGSLLKLYYFKDKNKFISLYNKHEKEILDNKNMFIYSITLYHFQKQVDLPKELKHILKSSFITLNETDRKNIIKIYMKKNDATSVSDFINIDSSLIKEPEVYNYILTHHESLNRLNSSDDQIILYFKNKRTYFSSKSFKKSKSLTSKSISKNLLIYRNIFSLKYYRKYLKTIKGQDGFFFRVESLNKKLAKAKWQSHDLKDKAFMEYEKLLISAIKRISLNKTEISNELIKVLDKYLSKIKEVRRV